MSDEQLAAFLEGNLPAGEMEKALQTICDSPELQETISIAERVDEDMEEMAETRTILPMARLAASSEGNLCDLQCEQWVLGKRGVVFDPTLLSTDALTNRWLRDKGTPLHNMGRLLEANGLSVRRRYNVSISDLIVALERGEDAVVVVDDSLLHGDEERGDFHAVAVVSMDGDIIRIYDPATGNDTDDLPLQCFFRAWEKSSFYMVEIDAPISEYVPIPINLEDITLSDDLLDLREAIAENTHDVWAKARMDEGWTYGPERDDKLKKHPDLVPYARLTEGEKEYDRIMAFNTIKLMKKLGYDLVKIRQTDSYKKLMHRLQHAEKEYRCPKCGNTVFKANNFCPDCGTRLDWKTFL